MCLSKSMERSFHALKSRKARDAYVEAELVNGLAHQIRIIRQERGWTQKQLAEKLETTQTTVSRLEDPSYGRYTIRTLLALGRVFDVAFFVRYLPFSKFLPATWDTRPENFEAAAYEDEVSSIQFFTENKSGTYVSKVITSTSMPDYTLKKIINGTPVSILSNNRIAKGDMEFFMSRIVNNCMLNDELKTQVGGE